MRAVLSHKLISVSDSGSAHFWIQTLVALLLCYFGEHRGFKTIIFTLICSYYSSLLFCTQVRNLYRWVFSLCPSTYTVLRLHSCLNQTEDFFISGSCEKDKHCHCCERQLFNASGFIFHLSGWLEWSVTIPAVGDFWDRNKPELQSMLLFVEHQAVQPCC